MVTNNRDSLRVLLVDSFNLPAEKSSWEITQEAIESWDFTGDGAAIAPPTADLASMNRITPDQVREFLLTKYITPIRELGLDPSMVGDDFDFLLRGVIDSFGILTMITSIEDEFHILLDMERLDAEQITILGPLSRYVAEQSRRGDQSACA